MVTGGLQYAMSIIDKNFGVGIGKAKTETEGLDKATNKANASTKKLASDGKKDMNGLAESIMRVGEAWLGIETIKRLVDFGGEIAEVTDKAQKLDSKFGLNFGAAGAKNLELVDQRAKDLNLSIESNRNGFISMAQSMNGTKISGKNLMSIYDGVAVASAAMKISGKDNEAMLNSFGDVAKKRIVEFGDFQSQFGDKIPGAFKIAANAMGMSEKSLKHMMDEGKINADKFLPKFANQLKTTFQDGLPAAANSMQAAMNKKENAVTGFWEKLSGFFGPGIAELLSKGAGFIDWFGTVITKLAPVGDAFWRIIVALKPLWDALIGVMSMFGFLSVSSGGLADVLNVIAVVVDVLARGIGVFIQILGPVFVVIMAIVAAVWLWNFAMAANPIMIVVLAIAALIGIISMAYQKIGWFRGAIMAAWEAVKGFAKAIKDYVINRFMEILSGVSGIGKAIMLFFKGDWNGAWEAGKKATADLMGINSKKKLISDLADVGKKSGEAYHKGVAQAKANNDLAAASGKSPVVDPKTANSKFFEDYKNKTKSDGTINPEKKTKSLSGGGGDSKHVTFNIHSFVDKMTIATNNLGGAPADIKREMQKIFNEIISDLEVRVNA